MKVKYHFFVVFFEFYNFFVSFSKCESILDRAATQVPTKNVYKYKLTRTHITKKTNALEQLLRHEPDV